MREGPVGVVDEAILRVILSPLLLITAHQMFICSSGTSAEIKHYEDKYI